MWLPASVAHHQGVAVGYITHAQEFSAFLPLALEWPAPMLPSPAKRDQHPTNYYAQVLVLEVVGG